MVARRIALPLALVASAALAVPASQAAAKQLDPVAHSAGGDPVPLNPAVVGTAIIGTDDALSSAAHSINQGNGAQAAKPLTSARRYLIRSYNGARYLIALPPPAPADDAKASAAKFRTMARRVVRASHRGSKARSRWIRAQASQDVVPPAFADNPTAVFNVFMSQYAAATAAVGMYPDTTGALQKKVKLVLNTAIILRNRLVKAVAAAEPPAPADDAAVHAHSSQEEGVPTYAAVMPGLVVLLDDEIQQMKAAAPSMPAASRDDLNKAIAADQKIETLVNTLWPPVTAD